MQPSVFIRARNGAFYEHPTIVFPEGYAAALADGTWLLILWLGEYKSGIKPAKRAPQPFLDSVFGVGRWKDVEHYYSGDMVPAKIPGTDPILVAASVAFAFKITERCPVPNATGSAGYRRVRDRNAMAMDFQVGRDDAMYAEPLPLPPPRTYILLEQ